MEIFRALQTNITDLRSKVTETADGFLLNTNYYEGENLFPIPFEALSLYSSPYSLNIERLLYCQAYGWRRPENIVPVIQDSHNLEQYYIRAFSGFVSGTSASYLWNVKEKNLKIESNYVYSPGDLEFLSYVCQDQTRIYYLMRSNQTIYLYRYLKNSTTIQNAWSVGSDAYGYPNPVTLHSDDAYIWISYYMNQNCYFLRHRKSDGNNTVCSIYRGGTGQATANLYGSIQSDYTVNLGNGIYGIYQLNLGNLEQPLDLYTVNTEDNFTTTYADACNIQHCTITWNDEMSEILYKPSIDAAITHFYNIFKINNSGNEYLCIAVYEKNYSNAQYTQVQGIYTFLKIDNTNFKFKHYSHISNRQIGGILLDKTNTTAIIALTNAAIIVKFDNNTEGWINIDQEIVGIYSIGFDKYNRIWYQKQDSSIEVVNFEDPQTVNIEFEKPYYIFEDEEIQTYITFSASNYINDGTTTSHFELIMEGSGKFSETNNQKYTFEYTGGIKQIPIIINGFTPVSICPSYISEN